MEVRVLGDLEVVGPAGVVPVRQFRHRQLLAALVVASGESRSSDALVDALWEESPPSSAGKLVQVYVSRLRKVLPDEARLRTTGSGYQLDVEPGLVDSVRFERLLASGRDALDDANPELAGSLLRQALSLWRGRAYGELADCQFARLEAARLDELRLVALETRIEADLAGGHHEQIVSELVALAAAHPLRERLQAQAMTCLYRCGRQTEALELFTALHTALNEELGLEPGTQTREVQARILRHDPALAPAARAGRPSRLPAPVNRLIGRERDVRDITGLLHREGVRLVVLTGTGGSGKTRLAIEVARRSEGGFANGTAFVPLAPLRAPDRVAELIAGAVGMTWSPQSGAADLADYLSRRELLLVLDNVEQLGSATPLFTELLARAPRLKLLVTSRSVLHLTGEHAYPVDPLESGAAVELFVERARAVDPAFEPSPADAEVVEGICDRLDRLPLAIELVTSRLRMLTPTELLSRLEPCLPLLADGPRDVPARQQTMHATVGWSHDLLDQPARRDFRRLGVFVAGCTLEAAEAVCRTTLDRLGVLVECSLLQRHPAPGGSRYGMLQTVREYATEQLRAAGDLPRTSERHLSYFLGLAERCNLYAEAEGAQDFDTANAEQENFRAAIGWARRTGQTVAALRLTVALENFWVTHNPHEGIQLLTRFLDDGDVVPPPLRARALRALGGSTHTLGDAEQAERLYQQSRQAFVEAAEDKQVAILDYRLGLLALDRRDIPRASLLLEQARGVFRATGSKRGEAQVTGGLGTLALVRGDRTLAARLFRDSAEMCAQIGRPWWQALMLAALAELALEDGTVEQAADWAKQLVRLAHHIGDRRRTLLGLDYLACTAARMGRAELAGHLGGAADAERRASMDAPAADRHADHLREVLARPDLAFQRGIRQGRQLSLEEVVEQALDAPLGTADRPVSLNRRLG